MTVIDQDDLKGEEVIFGNGFVFVFVFVFDEKAWSGWRKSEQVNMLVIAALADWLLPSLESSFFLQHPFPFHINQFLHF